MGKVFKGSFPEHICCRFLTDSANLITWQFRLISPPTFCPESFASLSMKLLWIEVGRECGWITISRLWDYKWIIYKLLHELLKKYFSETCYLFLFFIPNQPRLNRNAGNGETAVNIQIHYLSFVASLCYFISVDDEVLSHLCWVSADTGCVIPQLK